MPSTTLLFLAAVPVVWLTFGWLKKRVKLPPGPKGWPIIGNLLDLPSSFMHVKLDEWAKQFGPIYCYSVLGQTIVVLSSYQVAADILDKQSNRTSDRPNLIKANEYYTRKRNMMLMAHSELWRSQRRAFHANFSIGAATKYFPLQEEESAYLVRTLLKYPDTPIEEHLHRLAGSNSFRSVFGGPIAQFRGEEPWKTTNEYAVVVMEAMLPGKSVVDMIPMLNPIIARSKWLRRASDRIFHWIEGVQTNLFDQGVLHRDSDVSPSMVQDLHDNEKNYGLDRTQSIWVTGTAFTGGQETTYTTERFFILAMTLHPEVVKKAQAEIDAVVGDRPPTFADREKLPYLEALIKEVLRWRPAAQIGVFHIASEDVVYDKYVIPKGAILLDNIWTQCHDPAVFPNPHAFDPSRYLTSTGEVLPPLPDTHEGYLAFGHGRRICPGRDFALNSLFIMAATLLWAFDFQKPLDAEGEEISPDPEAYVDNFLTLTPAPVKVKLVPRLQDFEERFSQ